MGRGEEMAPVEERSQTMAPGLLVMQSYSFLHRKQGKIEEMELQATPANVGRRLRYIF
jgi:hypothetical protein